MTTEELMANLASAPLRTSSSPPSDEDGILIQGENELVVYFRGVGAIFVSTTPAGVPMIEAVALAGPDVEWRHAELQRRVRSAGIDFKPQRLKRVEGVQ